MRIQPAPKIFQALSATAITRISLLADWLWDDHEEHAVQTPDGSLVLAAA